MAHGNELDQLLEAADTAAKGKSNISTLLAYGKVTDLLQGHRQEITDPTRRQRLAQLADARAKLIAAVRESEETRTMTVDVTVDVGVRAMELGKWKTGLDSLSDARRLIEAHLKPADRAVNEDYLVVLNSLAAGYLNTKKIPKAGELFDDAAPLGRATIARPTRELIWNRSIVDMIQKHRAMRGVKGLKEFMEANGNPVDEDLINLFGTAISIAAQHGQSDNRFLEACEQYYYTCNQKLEATRSGQKRWGVQWLSATDAAEVFGRRDQAMAEWKRRMGDVAAAGARLKQVQADATPHFGFGGMHRNASEADVEAARSALADRQRQASEAWAAVPQPPWLTEFKPAIPRRRTPSAPPIVVAAGPADAPTPTPPAPDRPVPEQPAPAPSIAPTPLPSIPTPEKRLVRYAVGFPVDPTHFVTAAEAIGNANSARMEDNAGNVVDAKVVAREGRLALLEAAPADLGGAIRYFNLAQSFAGGKIRCAAIPQPNLFGPSAALLDGFGSGPVPGDWTIGMSEHPRLPGAPLLSASGEVVGVVVAERDDPQDKLPAVQLQELRQFLESHHALPVPPCGNTDITGIFQIAAESE